MSMDAGVMIGLVVQAAALVWGASAISSSVKSLTKTVAKLDATVVHLDRRVQDHEVRLAVFEAVNAVERRREEPATQDGER